MPLMILLAYTKVQGSQKDSFEDPIIIIIARFFSCTFIDLQKNKMLGINTRHEEIMEEQLPVFLPLIPPSHGQTAVSIGLDGAPSKRWKKMSLLEAQLGVVLEVLLRVQLHSHIQWKAIISQL